MSIRVEARERQSAATSRRVANRHRRGGTRLPGNPIRHSVSLRQSGSSRHRNNRHRPGRRHRLLCDSLRLRTFARPPLNALGDSTRRGPVPPHAASARAEPFERPLSLPLGRSSSTRRVQPIFGQTRCAQDWRPRNSLRPPVVGSRYAEHLSAARRTRFSRRSAVFAGERRVQTPILPGGLADRFSAGNLPAVQP